MLPIHERLPQALQGQGTIILIQSFDDLKEAFEFSDKIGDNSAYDQEAVRFAMKEVERITQGRCHNFQEAMALLLRLSEWLRDNNHAHYFCTDSRQVNDDGAEIATIMHALGKPEQFIALHRFVDQSALNILQKEGL